MGNAAPGLESEIDRLTDTHGRIRGAARRVAEVHPGIATLEELTRLSFLATVAAMASYSGQGPLRYTPVQLIALKLCAYQLAIQFLRPSDEALAAFRDELKGGPIADALRWVDAPVLDVPCGFGKSESAKGFLIASAILFQEGGLGVDRYPGVLFAVDSTDELESVHRSLSGSLNRAGLKASEWLGVFHTLEDRKIQPIERDECPKYPILLMCAQQLQARAKEARRIPFAVGAKPFMQIGEHGKRALVIKDETLHVTECYVTDLNAIRHTAYTLCHQPTAAIKRVMDKNKWLGGFLVELEENLVAVADELQNDPAHSVRLCKVPAMDERLAGSTKVLANKLRKSHFAISSTLSMLAEIGSVIDLQVALHKRGEESTVVCKSVPCWPEEIKSVVTLDANWSADLLSSASNRYSRSRLMDLVKVPSHKLKDMAALRVHMAAGPCGSEAMTDSVKRRRLGKAIVDEILRIYRTTSERALVFTFLPGFRGGVELNHATWLRKWLIRAGIPADLICVDRDELQPWHRVAIDTWGRHKATNAYVLFENVLLLGLIQQPALGLQMHSWSEAGESNEGVKVLPWDLVELRRSQMVCDFIQAAMRGAARRSSDGGCIPMNLYCQIWDPGSKPMEFVRLSRQVLGNYELVNWEGVGQPVLPVVSREEEVKQVVLDLLDAATPDKDGMKVVSFMAAKAELRRRTKRSISSPTWQKRRTRASMELEKQGVATRGRSWVVAAGGAAQ